MRKSVELQICDAILAVLQDSSDLTTLVGSNLFIARGSAIDDKYLPAVDVVPGVYQPSQISRRVTKFTMALSVDIKLIHGDIESPFSASDPILLAIHDALSADDTLSGAVASIRIGPSEWTPAAGGNNAIANRRQEYIITGETSSGDISIKSR